MYTGDQNDVVISLETEYCNLGWAIYWHSYPTQSHYLLNILVSWIAYHLYIEVYKKLVLQGPVFLHFTSKCVSAMVTAKTGPKFNVVLLLAVNFAKTYVLGVSHLVEYWTVFAYIPMKFEWLNRFSRYTFQHLVQSVPLHVKTGLKKGVI